MKTPTRNPLWAIFVLLAPLLWLAARTIPGLTLITLGSLAGCLGRPWWGLAMVAVGALIYREQCSRSPYSPCLRCKGSGHHRKRHAKACRPCRGRGVRIRWGRAVMNAYRRATHTADTAPAARPARPFTPGTYADALRQSADDIDRR